mgnify:CR=1 FL=1
MSALNVTQAEADVLLDSLRMFAEVHRNAGGAVPAEVADLLVKLSPAPVQEAPAAAVAAPAPAPIRAVSRPENEVCNGSLVAGILT